MEVPITWFEGKRADRLILSLWRVDIVLISAYCVFSSNHVRLFAWSNCFLLDGESCFVGAFVLFFSHCFFCDLASMIYFPRHSSFS